MKNFKSLTNYNLSVRWALVFASILSSITVVHSDPQPSTELIIQKLLFEMHDVNSTNNTSSVALSKNDELLNSRTKTLLENFVFNPSNGRMSLTPREESNFLSFTMGMAKKLTLTL